MRVFVEVATEIDPLVQVRVDRLSGALSADLGDSLWQIGRAGRVGVEAALAIPGAVVTAFAVDEASDAALHHAQAAGTARAVRIGEEDLVAWFRAERADLVLCGLRAGALAARLGWSHLAGLTTIALTREHLMAVRSLGGGERERVEAVLPAIVRLSIDEAPAPRYIARARVRAADALAIPRVSLGGVPTESGLAPGGIQVARARVKSGAAPAPATGGRGADRLAALLGGVKSAPKESVKRAVATPVEQAEELVRYLAHHQLLVESK